MSSIWEQSLDSYPTDGIHTETSEAQAATEASLLNTLRTEPPSPPKTLARSLHASYIGRFLMSLPSPYVSLDASRPWLLYWSLHSFDLLGVGLDEVMKNKACATVLSFQHPAGGFGGGPGQLPHLLPTYASICSLAIAGSPEHWAQVDRQKLYEFFMKCKQPDGSFVVCEGGEVDVRGIYCLLVCATLLDLTTPELVDGVDRFIAACQTYEGGFASSSFSFASSSKSPEASPFEHFASPFGHGGAVAEAHGGYTSCALFSWWLMRPVFEAIGKPMCPINTHSLLRWAVMQQSYAIEGGGFRGRTNKLVDGCYGWWVGGLFAVLDELTGRVSDDDEGGTGLQAGQPGGSEVKKETHAEWEDLPEGKVALQEYILIAAQSEKGGLRDKPGKSADLYHTNNNLSGLSSAQHRMKHSKARVESLQTRWRVDPGQEDSVNSRRRTVYASALGWTEDESAFHAVGGDINRVVSDRPAVIQ